MDFAGCHRTTLRHILPHHLISCLSWVRDRFDKVRIWRAKLFTLNCVQKGRRNGGGFNYYWFDIVKWFVITSVHPISHSIPSVLLVSVLSALDHGKFNLLHRPNRPLVGTSGKLCSPRRVMSWWWSWYGLPGCVLHCNSNWTIPFSNRIEVNENDLC